jgi:tellurite resistance protein
MRYFLGHLTRYRRSLAAQHNPDVPFKDALLAMYALLATADGEQGEGREAAAFDQFQKYSALTNHDQSELAEQFKKLYRDALDPVLRRHVPELIVGKLDGKPDQADMAVVLALLYAVTENGAVAEGKRNVLREIVHKLGLNATTYGL